MEYAAMKGWSWWRSVVVSLAVLSGQLGARTWTNTEGKKIEADYVSHDETEVTLRINGKEVSYAISKLSEEDREYLARLEPEEPAKMETGYREKLPIAERLFQEPGDYYKQRDRRNFRKAFEDGSYKHADGLDLQGTFDDWIKRDPALDTYKVYVPPSYDGSTAYGLFLYISPNPQHHLPQEWFPLFDAYKLIAVAADNVDNHRPTPRRVQTSIDAMITVEKQYKVDPKRRVVSGLSGGGHMAMVTAATYPEYFIGAISHAAQSYLPYEDDRGYGHFAGFSLKDFTDSSRKHLKWIVVSGDKDFNYREILDTTKRWEGAKLPYRFLDVEGMGHEHAKPEPLKEAMEWVGLKEG